jgi:uncharacterized protein (DUF1697 family)
MATHVALLRGVNVGGRKLAMTDLRDIVSSLAHSDVSTYIQSGNALFGTSRTDTAELAAEIEKAIEDRLGMTVGVIVLSSGDLAAIIDANPYRDETDPKKLHAVVMNKKPSTDLMARIAAFPASGRDSVHNDGRTLYLHTPDGFGRSDLSARLMRLLGSPKSGVVATARNWSTISVLFDRLDSPR